MDGDVYALGSWKVKPGQEEGFIAAWKARTAFYNGLPNPPVSMVLTQGAQDQSLFFHVSSWKAVEDVQAAVADPRSVELAEKMTALCDDVNRLGASRVVA